MLKESALFFFNILHPPLNVLAPSVALDQGINTDHKLISQGYSDFYEVATQQVEVTIPGVNKLGIAWKKASSASGYTSNNLWLFHHQLNTLCAPFAHLFHSHKHKAMDPTYSASFPHIALCFSVVEKAWNRCRIGAEIGIPLAAEKS